MRILITSVALGLYVGHTGIFNIWTLTNDPEAAGKDAVVSFDSEGAARAHVLERKDAGAWPVGWRLVAVEASPDETAVGIATLRALGFGHLLGNLGTAAEPQSP